MLPWGVIRTLGELTDKAHCDKCGCWREIWRDATLTELLIGEAVPVQEPLPDDAEPPF